METTTNIQVEGYGEHKLHEIDVARRYLDALIRYYPNHNWFVNTANNGTWITVQLVYGSRANPKLWQRGMGINGTKISTQHDLERSAKMNGGELLERFFKARGAAKSVEDHIFTKVDDIAMVR